MRAARLVLFAAFITLTAPVILATPGDDPSQPLAAVAFIRADGASVTWVPGAVTPDSYVVYGVSGSSLSFLAIVPANINQASVTSTYPEYAVAAVTGETTSSPTFAVTDPVPCVDLDLSRIPPAFAIGACDTPGIPIPGKLIVKLPDELTHL